MEKCKRDKYTHTHTQMMDNVVRVTVEGLRSYLQAQHRVQFFQLVDIFLASGKVPAYTAAAFVKRFARLALSIPPAGKADITHHIL